MMDCEAPPPSSDLDGDVVPASSNMDSIQQQQQQQQQQQEQPGTSSTEMMEEEMSVNSRNVKLLLLESRGEGGEATNPTSSSSSSSCNARHSFVLEQDVHVDDASQVGNDGLDRSIAVQENSEPVQQTMANDGEHISTPQIVQERCDFTNTPDPITNEEGTKTQPLCDVVETNPATSLPFQEETSSNTTILLLPSHLSPPAEVEEQDDSTMMDSIKLTSSVVSASQTNNSVVDQLQPDTESSWCKDITLDQRPRQQQDDVRSTHEIRADETKQNDEAAVGCEDDMGDFTVIELVSPSNKSTTTTVANSSSNSSNARSFFLPNQTLQQQQQQQQQQLESDGDYNLVPALEEDTTMAPLLSPSTKRTIPTAIAASSNSIAPSVQLPSEGGNATTTSHHPLSSPQPPFRKKILRHPILTPLTKLPWDKFISAAGACDVLFNCKYSMRQVEDEVREEERKVRGGTGYHIMYGGEGGGGGGDIDDNEECGEGGVEVERQQQQGGGGNGKEDGYVNVNYLGHDCLDYGYDDKEGDCDVDEFAKLGLDCCSMLDNEVEAEEVEGTDGRTAQPLTNGNGVMGERWEHVVTTNKDGVEICAEGVARSVSQSSVSRPNAISDDHKAERSWTNSNPSLDMLLYRTMLNE